MLFGQSAFASRGWLARHCWATKLFARRRVKRSFQSAEWANAKTRVVNGLGAGDVQSRGLLPSGKTHVPIPAVEWMDLQVSQRGPNEDVVHADGSFAYHDVSIAAAQMLRHWPSKTAETLVSLRPSEAAANDESGTQARQTEVTRVAGALEVAEMPAPSRAGIGSHED
jgi:hypothetical protein